MVDLLFVVRKLEKYKQVTLKFLVVASEMRATFHQCACRLKNTFRFRIHHSCPDYVITTDIQTAYASEMATTTISQKVRYERTFKIHNGLADYFDASSNRYSLSIQTTNCTRTRNIQTRKYENIMCKNICYKIIKFLKKRFAISTHAFVRNYF